MVLLLTVLYSAVIILTGGLPAPSSTSSTSSTSIPAVGPASLVMAGVTEGCRVVLEDLLGQGKTEGSPVSWAGLVQEVQVLVRGGLEGLGQSQSQVRVLAV